MTTTNAAWIEQAQQALERFKTSRAPADAFALLSRTQRLAWLDEGAEASRLLREAKASEAHAAAALHLEQTDWAEAARSLVVEFGQGAKGLSDRVDQHVQDRVDALLVLEELLDDSDRRGGFAQDAERLGSLADAQHEADEILRRNPHVFSLADAALEDLEAIDPDKEEARFDPIRSLTYALSEATLALVSPALGVGKEEETNEGVQREDVLYWDEVAGALNLSLDGRVKASQLVGMAADQAELASEDLDRLNAVLGITLRVDPDATQERTLLELSFADPATLQIEVVAAESEKRSSELDGYQVTLSGGSATASCRIQSGLAKLSLGDNAGSYFSNGSLRLASEAGESVALTGRLGT